MTVGRDRQHFSSFSDASPGKLGEAKGLNNMNATEKKSNTYLAISFATAIFWSAPLVWLYPKAAVWVGMAVVIIVYSTLCFLGNASDD